jgi:hypothetical protein
MTSSFQTNIEPHIPWLAGVLQGHGSFGVNFKETTSSPYSYLSVQLVDQELLSYIAFLFDSNVSMSQSSQHPEWQPLARTTLLQKDKLAWLMPRLLPYLSPKKQTQVQQTAMTPYLFDQTKSLFASSSLPEPHAKENSPNDLKILLDSEAQWLTGFMEARGHIHFDRRSTIPSPGVVIKSSDKDVIAYVSLLLNQPYTEKHLPKSPVEWKVSVKARPYVAALLPQLLPHCHGSHLPNNIHEAMTACQNYETWKALPTKNRPTMWPNRTPKKRSETETRGL